LSISQKKEHIYRPSAAKTSYGHAWRQDTAFLLESGRGAPGIGIYLRVAADLHAPGTGILPPHPALDHQTSSCRGATANHPGMSYREPSDSDAGAYLIFQNQEP